MHPVKLSLEELQQLKEASKTRDWKILKSWRLRYLYQRCIALPRREMKPIKEIAAEAKEEQFYA